MTMISVLRIVKPVCMFFVRLWHTRREMLINEVLAHVENGIATRIAVLERMNPDTRQALIDSGKDPILKAVMRIREISKGITI